MNPVNSDRRPLFSSVGTWLHKPPIRVIRIILFHLEPLKSPFCCPLCWVVLRVLKPEFVGGGKGGQVDGRYNLLGHFFDGTRGTWPAEPAMNSHEFCLPWLPLGSRW